MAIKFVYGAQSQYDELLSQDYVLDDALYFVNDTQRIYRGKEVIARIPLRFVSAVPETPESDVLYIVTTPAEPGKDAVVDVYSSDGSSVVKVTSSDGNIDVKDVFDQLAKFTSEDVKVYGIDVADDTKLATAGAVREALTWTIM